MEWQIRFGQSPECKSFAQAYSKKEYTFTNCGIRDTIISGDVATQSSPAIMNYLYPLEIPPALVRRFSPSYYDTCCGACELGVAEVNLYYFADSKGAACQKNQTSNTTSTQSLPGLGRRMNSIEADEITAIVSGHTL